MVNWEKIDINYGAALKCLPLILEQYSKGVVLSGDQSAGWGYHLLAGFGVAREHTVSTGKDFSRVNDFLQAEAGFVFAHWNYELKQLTEQIPGKHNSSDGFSRGCLFVPEIIVRGNGTELELLAHSELSRNHFLALLESGSSSHFTAKAFTFRERTSKERYLQNAGKILQHIHRGDIYEMNYCIEFFADRAAICPASVFHRLTAITKAPFSGIYKSGDAWLICGSPELYLEKSGASLQSKPIKGTRRRGNNETEDELLRNELQNDPKERSENVMIVDLVRNDLSKVASKNSVHVPELWAIAALPNVFQLYSTVQCGLRPGAGMQEIISATFPMGSMTGAPKVRAMQIIEEFEDQSRGIYSGSIGYIAPNQDFVFNVVIRSITWNQQTGYLSVKAGSALTASCLPEKEYEECLLKAKAMMDAVKTV